MASDDPFLLYREGQATQWTKERGLSEAIKRRTDNPMDKRESGHQRPYREGQTTQWTKEKGVMSVLLLFMASDEPFLFCSLGCLSFSLWPLMGPFSFFHWVVCPSLYDLCWALSLLFNADNPNRQKRKRSSEAIKRRRTDNPMEKRERGDQRPKKEGQTTQWTKGKWFIRGFSLVHWVVCLSLYGLRWPLFLWSIGLSVLLFMTSDDRGQTTQWTKEKGVIRGHKEKNRQSNGQQRKGHQRP
jgi:hypothetical protein